MELWAIAKRSTWGLFPIIPFGALPAVYLPFFIARWTMPTDDFFLGIYSNFNGARAPFRQTPDLGGFLGWGIILGGCIDNKHKKTGVFPAFFMHFLRYVSIWIEEMGHC